MNHFSFDPLSSALAAFSAFVGFVVWLARVHFMTNRNAGDIVEMRSQIATALSAVTSIERLADAVKYGSDLTAQQIANLAEKVAEHAAYTKEQFVEIKGQMKHDRANASMAATAAAVGRRKAETARED